MAASLARRPSLAAIVLLASIAAIYQDNYINQLA